ncbi:unnamed protein product [Withania somnifera]
MDSCNTGSVKSSSDDDQEYDSHRGASISTFLNSSSHFGPILSSQLPQYLAQQPSLFDPYDSQNFNSIFQDSSDSPYNNDLIWPKDIRSDHPNYKLNNFGNLTSSSSIAPPPHQGPWYDSTSIPINPFIVQPKNPKKRSRASWRAPTTVLTTNTTNFRQMVQEFTGIPTTPFTDSAYTHRLDLFSTASLSMKRSAHLDNILPLNYTLKSSTQKLQNSQFMITPPNSSLVWSSSMIDTLMPATNSIVGTTNASTFGQISKSLTSTIPLDEMGMSHHEQVIVNLGGLDHYDQCGTFGEEEHSRKDRNI